MRNTPIDLDHTPQNNAEKNYLKADDVFEVIFISTNETAGVYASTLVDITDFDSNGLRALNLNVAPPSQFPYYSETIEDIAYVRGGDEGREMNAIVTARLDLAIGQYLHYLETNGVSESDAWSSIIESIPGEWLDEYTDYVDGLDKKERAKEMMNQAQRKTAELHKQDNQNPFWDKTLDEGSWREKGLSQDGERLANNIIDGINADPRSCHYTATKAVRRAANDDRVKYCEGLVMPKSMGRTTRHAWIEIDGCVAEVTWPWHHVDGSDALYYGSPIHRAVLDERIESRAVGRILLLDDDEYQLWL